MGDPRFPRRRYDTPSHPWNAERIAAEKTLVRKYGLKNKREIWKSQTRLREFRGTARELLSKQHTPTPQVEKESRQLLSRMNRIGLLGDGATLDDILGLDVENLLARRLQTVVYLKGLASTPKQARQFITHGHVTIGDTRVTVPSYIVTKDEEEKIEINAESAVSDPTHPVRARPETVPTPTEDRRSRRGGEAPPEGTQETPAETTGGAGPGKAEEGPPQKEPPTAGGES
jgi:small subunit ribosomal protein S4